MHVMQLTPDYFLPGAPVDAKWLNRRSPLKSNALDTLLKTYGQMGFATSPVKVQKSTLVIRIVWIHRSFRKKSPYYFYEPVAAVTIPLSDDFLSSPWAFRLLETRYASIFKQFFPEDVFKSAHILFSEKGISEVETFVRTRASGHPRTVQSKRRMRIIAELPELWHDPTRIAHILRDCGLYSEKTPIDQHRYHVEAMIRKLRVGSGKPIRPSAT